MSEPVDASPPQEVRLTNETIEFLEQRIASAVQNGITAAVSEEAAEKFWAAGMSALQKAATQHTGRFVLGGVFGLFKRLWLFFALAGIVYITGGWGALLAFGKALFSASPP